MEKIKMQTPNLVDENIEKIGRLFPDCLTERTVADGKTEQAIDFDKLKQELSKGIVDGDEERYQFTWPGKKQAIITANAPINKTLRPCREESVDFDNTQNLYIEGDNLDVLKLLREDYLGKVKVIYIDPPYNTGNDFVYKDEFAQSTNDYIESSGQMDDEGNRLVANTESNGRFHTDWLNMIYPRLKVAKDLLSGDGAIFISIDDNEVENLKKVCDEIFGETNFVASFPWRKRTAKTDVPFGVSQDYEQIICYAKSQSFQASIQGKERKYYETPDFPGRPWRVHDLTTQRTAAERPNSNFTIRNPKTGDEYPANPNRTWAITVETFQQYYAEGKIVFPGDYSFLSITKPVLRYWKEDDIKKAGESFGRIAVSTKLPESVGMSQDGTKELSSLFGSKVFDYPKPSSLIKYLLSVCTKEKDLILDFFSGSATTADAVMQLNADDGGTRKFILVQLPEAFSDNSIANQSGVKNICELAEDRIRRAGQKILEGHKANKTDSSAGSKTNIIDVGFRTLKLDSSNMKDVYYKPSDVTNDLFAQTEDNIKGDRTDEDLLFQMMLEMAVPLSAKISSENICGKKVLVIDDDYLIACFDKDITDEVVTDIAKRKPQYFVMRDSSAMDDSVITNFETIFLTYSKDTIRIIL